MMNIRAIRVLIMGLGLGLVLGSLGGFFFLPIACTITGGSYDGMGMIAFMMVGAAAGTGVGAVLGLVVGLVVLLRQENAKGMPER